MTNDCLDQITKFAGDPQRHCFIAIPCVEGNEWNAGYQSLPDCPWLRHQVLLPMTQSLQKS